LKVCLGNIVTTWLFSAILLTTLIPLNSYAAQTLPAIVDPGVIQQRSIERQKRLLEEERSRTGQKIPANPLETKELEKPKTKKALPAIRFLLKKVVFSPSKILSKDELNKIAAEYEDRQVTFADLQALVHKVNLLYRAKAAIAAEAVIPPQDVSNGVVRIRLVEGKIGAYQIKGNNSTRRSYVLARLHEQVGSLIDTKKLEQDMIWFNRTNDAKLRAKLTPGKTFGTTDIHLKLLEPLHQSIKLFTDNNGDSSTGEHRMGAIYQNNSLLGYRDQLTASVTGSDGDKGYSLGYSAPFNTWGGRAEVDYYKDRTHVKYGPFTSLNLTGTSRSCNMSLRQPIYVVARGQVDISLSYIDRTITTWIDTVELQHIKLNDFVVGLGASGNFSKASWGMNIDLTTGRMTTPGELSYNILRGSLHGNWYFPKGNFAHFNLGWQTTDNDLLPSSELYFIGGPGTVRGYTIDGYSGNSGYAANLELHHQFINQNSTKKTTAGIDGFIFLDSGEARPKGVGMEPIHLYSTGVGADLSFHKWLHARLTCGYQLHRQSTEPRAYRINFTLLVSTF